MQVVQLTAAQQATLDHRPHLSSSSHEIVAALQLGARVDEVRGSLDREPAQRDIEVAFGTIQAGTCGAVRTRAAGMVNGREAIIVDHIIRMARDVAPAG